MQRVLRNFSRGNVEVKRNTFFIIKSSMLRSNLMFIKDVYQTVLIGSSKT